ncbi:sigma-E processing peptidase SpoIIGA [Thalassobacillus pellis]|uniref:sigma-E processing peptidase SpoIIGA n=1 Tax=Thalassobacillus pellis TaxID=748008 RepID=UPI00195FACCA|nr:sigma-E processing peptidase SpoIIGA [Thalassobacillus pellis]MBM7552843.1 stage II sporulation protein GA (sporulation sigma-E factor processing peptidase) [Thalassobacillus pellis]
MIYLDAVWLLNFLLDGMILTLTLAVTKSYAPKGRVMTAAFVASLIVPLTIYFPDSFLTSPAGKFIYSIAIISVAFSFKSLKIFLRNLVTFYFITFALGGALMAGHFFIQSNIHLSSDGMVTFSGGYGDPVSWLFVLIGFPVAWYFTKKRLEGIAVLKMKYEEIYDVSIEWKGKTVSSRGLVDSGNHLRDPITNKLVFLGDQVVFESFFNGDEWSLLKEVGESFDIGKIPERLQKDIRFIPYQGASGGSQFMLALQVDAITVHTKENTILLQKVLLGLQFGNMTEDDSYHVLLHPLMMQKGKVA